MSSGTRGELLSCLVEAVGAVRTAHPVRVAVDGVPGAGKTTLADELAAVLRAQGRDVIRATIEGFLTPRSVRHPRGDEYRSRYVPSQLFYFEVARPADHADIIVHNDEPRQPAWWVRTR